MKILYLNTDRGIPVLGDKGASVHVRSFISAAVALGHEVVLACTALGDGNPPPPARIIHLVPEPDETDIVREGAELDLRATELEDPVVRRELARLGNDRTLPERLLGKLRRIDFEPDLVYERHALFHQSGVRIAALLGVPRLLEVNAPLIAEQAKYRALRLVAAALDAQRRSYRAAAAIVAVSEAVATHVRGIIGSTGTLHVVPNGVNRTLFSGAGAGIDVREIHTLGPGPVIGFVGSFKPWHGIGLLLDVFESLVAGRPGLRLVAIGDGPDLPMARARASQSVLAGRVLLPGRIAHAEVPAWMAAMDVTVAPYLPQPDFYFSPMKIIEALAAGIPVVAPRVGQIPELVRDGHSGVLFSPGDASELAVALATLIDDPLRRRSMGNAARVLSEGRDWTAVVNRILALAPTAESPRSA